jgi:N-terminal domain of galactosyltransferase
MERRCCHGRYAKIILASQRLDDKERIGLITRRCWRIVNSQQISRLTVMIPWCDRPEIKTTLEENAPILRQFDSEVFILNCGGDPRQLEMLISDSKFSSAPEIRVIDLLCPRFNKSYALNVGAYLSRSSRIFVLDADVLVNLELVSNALEILERPAFVTVERVLESQRIDDLFGRESSKRKPLSVVRTHFVDISLADGNDIRICTFRRDEVDGSRAGPGLIFVRKEHLIQVEGYNADLQYWGWEDVDLQVRLKKVLALEHREVGSVIHLSHDDGMRALFGGSQQSSNRSNLGVCCERYAQSNFLGTYSRDVQSWLTKEPR